MDFTLTNDEQEFIESFRTFCKKEIAPFAEELDRKKELPRTHYTKLAEAGYLGLMHEEEYGGQGAGLFLSTLAMEVVSEYCGSTFFSVGASGGLFGLPLKHFGTKEQKKNIYLKLFPQRRSDPSVSPNPIPDRTSHRSLRLQNGREMIDIYLRDKKHILLMHRMRIIVWFLQEPWIRREKKKGLLILS